MDKLDLIALAVNRGTEMLELVRKSRRVRRMYYAALLLAAYLGTLEYLAARFS